jgi:EAL domain-containing protein (putative c-di-GMP-specific phosphodiesterase class I)
VGSIVPVLGALRDMGVRVAIDDFGTGYSSLAYLKGLPGDEVKIDRSFIGELVTDRGDAAIVRSIIALSHDLGLAVTAATLHVHPQGGGVASNRHSCRVTQLSEG